MYATRSCRGFAVPGGRDDEIRIRRLPLVCLSGLGRLCGLARVPVGVLPALEPDAAKRSANCEASADQRVPWEGHAWQDTGARAA